MYAPPDPLFKSIEIFVYPEGGAVFRPKITYKCVIYLCTIWNKTNVNKHKITCQYNYGLKVYMHADL